MQAIPRVLVTLVRRFERAPRWPYWIPGVIAFAFVGHAFEDGGPRSGAIYSGIVLLSILQTIRPTVLGWILLFAPFVACAAVVAASPGNGPVHEWLIFMLLGFVPSAAMWLGRPWKHSSLVEGSDARRP